MDATLCFVLYVLDSKEIDLVCSNKLQLLFIYVSKALFTHILTFINRISRTAVLFTAYQQTFFPSVQNLHLHDSFVLGIADANLRLFINFQLDVGSTMKVN